VTTVYVYGRARFCICARCETWLILIHACAQHHSHVHKRGLNLHNASQVRHMQGDKDAQGNLCCRFLSANKHDIGFVCGKTRHPLRVRHLVWVAMICSIPQLRVAVAKEPYCVGLFVKRHVAIEEVYTLQPLHVGIGDAVFFTTYEPYHT